VQSHPAVFVTLTAPSFGLFARDARHNSLPAFPDQVTALCRQASDLLDDPSPIDALFSWLDTFVVHVSTKRALAVAATEGSAGRRSERFDRWHESMRLAAATLLDQAGSAGVVRRDLTATDLLALASGAALAGIDLAHARRLVQLMRSGVEVHRTAPID
jgi:hypothetical protein